MRLGELIRQLGVLAAEVGDEARVELSPDLSEPGLLAVYQSDPAAWVVSDADLTDDMVCLYVVREGSR